MANLANQLIEEVRAKVGNGRVVAGLSGGVDSSVAATLVHKAIGDRLTCIFVDHGLLRLNEAEEVMGFYRNEIGLNVIEVNAKDRFLSKLAGVTEPERKRKIIGEEFIRVFEDEAKKIGADYLLQGTIYPDVIESGAGGASVIKSHHNVGGLPEDIAFKGLIEPLRILFKDEVRSSRKFEHARSPCMEAALPGSRACDPHPRRHYRRKARHPEKVRLYPPR